MEFSQGFQTGAWKGRRVLILGLGQYPKGSGVSAALAFARAGADVIVTDLKTERELAMNVKRLKRFKNVRFVLGHHDLEDVDKADLIVANPRVRPNSPEMRRARKKRIPVASDISLFLDRCTAPVIAVTGTRGKSTTSSLIAAMLKASGKRVWLGGNILVSPLTFLSKIRPSDIVVLELSSWQCESLPNAKRAPHIAVVTNLMRDHLNAYDGMEDYVEAKAQIFRHQRANDVSIFNIDDPLGKSWMREAPGIVRTFGRKSGADAACIRGVLRLRKTAVLPVAKMRLIGEHNAMNACAALLASVEAGATLRGMRKALRVFSPLPNRLETVRLRNGVRYVNDTTATTPDGTIAAVRALDPISKHLWLIIGGADKELEYGELAALLNKEKRRLSILLLPGDASEKLRHELVMYGIAHTDIATLPEAVREAATKATRGDTVVLSPAAASFNQFRNEFERGDVFKKAVRRLK